MIKTKIRNLQELQEHLNLGRLKNHVEALQDTLNQEKYLYETAINEMAANYQSQIKRKDHELDNSLC